MEIQLLTVPGCPHREPTLARLRQALDRAGHTHAVLIDGVDPFTAGPETSLSCRLYPSAAGLQGAPSVDDLVEALTA